MKLKSIKYVVVIFFFLKKKDTEIFFKYLIYFDIYDIFCFGLCKINLFLFVFKKLFIISFFLIQMTLLLFI